MQPTAPSLPLGYVHVCVLILLMFFVFGCFASSVLFDKMCSVVPEQSIRYVGCWGGKGETFCCCCLGTRGKEAGVLS